MKILIPLLLVLFTTICSAQHKVLWQEKVKPSAPISQNFVFVIDASSTINTDDGVRRKFSKAWLEISKLIGMDEIYYSVFIFHDEGAEKFIPWVAGHHSFQHRVCPCIQGEDNVVGCTFSQTKRIVLQNTGVRSYGQAAIRKALREKVPKELNNNWSSRQTLSLVIISDGGFSEAADPNIGIGSFSGIEDAIVQEQAKRLADGMATATIITVGLENKADWSTAVKKSDEECQAFLKKIGTKYGGGYFLVKRPSRASKRIS